MPDSVTIGIDFGTSNSVVAVVHQGRAQVLRNADGRDVTPSVVGVNQHEELLVGEAAERLAVTLPNDTAEAFKRLMGTDQIWRFPSTGSSYSSSELASFVLSDLRRTATEFLGRPPDAAVVTIPAVFGEPQKAALIEAGARAGFRHVTLIQEPVAAGLAYGWDSKAERPFLVFDMGAGTFDVAVVQVVERQLVVRAQRGLSALGGRDIDARILDSLLLPRISAAVAESELPSRRRLLLKLCEDAKIRLSRAESVVVSLAEGHVHDSGGVDITDVVQLTRADVDPLIIDLVDLTLPIIKQVLEEAGLNEADVEAMILVGGPTRIPVLRQRLQQAFRIPLETAIDPLSVVAQGAAYHAASLPVLDLSPPETPAEVVTLRIEFDRVATASPAPVGVALDPLGQIENARLRVRRSDRAWESGWIDFSHGSAILDVLLSDAAESTFNLELVDSTGTHVTAVSPGSFTMLRGIAAAPPPLSQPIGIVVKGSDSHSSLSFDVVADRGDPTPLTRKRSYRTTRTIMSGDDSSVLEVHFRQGQSEIPLRNQAIGIVAVRGSDLTRSLSRGAEVQITLRIDPASKASASVYIRELDQTFEEKLEGDEDSVGDEGLRARLEDEGRRIRDLGSSGAQVELLSGLAKGVNTELAKAEAGDTDSRARAAQEITRLEKEVDQLDQRLGPAIAAKQLSVHAELARELVDEFGTSNHKRRLALLEETRLVQSVDDQAAVRSLDRAFVRLGGEVWWQQPEAWVYRFRKLVEDMGRLQSAHAQQLVVEGNTAIEQNDLANLRAIVLQLEELGAGSEDELLSRFSGLRQS